MALSDLRREYTLSGLRRRDLLPDPLDQFKTWFEQAAQSLPKSSTPSPDVNAMTLATSDKHGVPSARIVLLKGVDKRGFVFFTNYESRKARELAENPNAALTFYWPHMERQICVAGQVDKISRTESEEYFKTRPRASRIAAWASKQSVVLPNRAALEQEWSRLESQYPGEDIPIPPFWGGYVLSPSRLEYWQGRPSRLHDRFRYFLRPDKSWSLERLSP